MNIRNNGAGAVSIVLPFEYATGYKGNKVISSLKRVVIKPGDNEVDDVVKTPAGSFKLLDFIKGHKSLFAMVKEGLLKVQGLEKEYKTEADAPIIRMKAYEPADTKADTTSDELAQLRAMVEGQAKLIEILQSQTKG
jgi:hypothetical protein